MQLKQIGSIMTTEIVTVAPDCLLKDAVATMQKYNISFLIAALNRKPLGVLTERDIVHLALDHVDSERTRVRDIMSSPVITVAEHANIFQVYDILSTKKIRHIAVADDDGLLLGVVTLTNILSGMSIEYFVELKQVANVMSQNICVLEPGDTVQQAIELMYQKYISCVVITREKKPVGIITERNITRLYGSTIEEDAAVETIMSQPVRTVAVDTVIPEVNSIMREEKLRHLVVVDNDDNLVGLVSQSDVAHRIEDRYVTYMQTLIKHQQQQLQYENERFSMLFSQNPNAVMSFDLDGNILDINSAAIVLSGYSQKEIIGKSHNFFMHPEDLDCALESIHQAREGKEGHTEFRIKQKSGGIVHVFNSCLPIYIDGQLHEIYNIMHDITERKKAQQKVRNAEEKTHLLSEAVEQAGDSIIITDSQGTIEFVNKAFLRTSRFTKKEAIGKKSSILKSGEQDNAFYEEMWGTITQGKIWSSRLMDRRRNGEFFPAELTISPVQNTEGEITHYIGIKRDLTEREELEENFRQTQKMDALGTLVGGIAHDFNNMLAGMTGNLYLAKQRTSELPDVVHKLDNIEEISFRAADMIQQLLTFARKDRVSMKQMPLSPYIKETLILLSTLVPENIDIHQEICNDPLQIIGYSTQLHQVLMNLLSNARDAVEGVDDPRITVRLESFDADEILIRSHESLKAGLYAHLSVEDNGCGIPEHQIKKLFEPFFTTKEQGKGTGLGLAMVFGAIKSHQGFIEVDSVEGKGSIFHIYIPLMEQENIASVVSLQKQEAAMGHGEMILLVDDQQQIIETGKDVLESLGYQVLTAINGQQAVEIFKAHSEEINLIILDVVMPVMGGGKVAQYVRQMSPHVKVIFSTGYDKNLLTNMENETVINKPFSIIEMSHLIRQQLNA